jgi:hypothetical protein
MNRNPESDLLVGGRRGTGDTYLSLPYLTLSYLAFLHLNLLTVLFVEIMQGQGLRSA